MICKSAVQLATLFLVLALQLNATALPTTSHPTTTASPSSSIKIENVVLSSTKASSYSTTSTTATPQTLPLYFIVTAITPAHDPLGISQVSSLYGPGTWAGWLLTCVAAWSRIFRRPEDKLDPNTWLFLIIVNIAAVDIFRGVHALRNIPQPPQPLPSLSSSTEDAVAAHAAAFSRHMGALGAAIIVAFWGSVTALAQILIWIPIMRFKGFKCHKQRLWTLAGGLVLPLTALLASAYILYTPVDGISGGGSNLLPALYWHGMSSSSHSFIILVASTSLLLLPYIVCTSISPLQWASLSSALDRLSQKKTIQKLVMIYLTGATISIFFTPLSMWMVLPMILLVTPFYLLLWSIVAVYSIMGYCVIYVFKAYLHLGSNASKSCFFMPCAPQSIVEEDQLVGLLVGLMFLGAEIYHFVFIFLKRRRSQGNLSLETVEAKERQLSVWRTTTAGLQV
jgi:hypothetical protein